MAAPGDTPNLPSQPPALDTFAAAMAEALPHAAGARARPLERPDEGRLKRCRGKKWSFTIMDYTKEDIKRVEALTEQDILCGIASCDRGESESPSVKGYVNFRTTQRYAAVRKLLPRAHLKPERGPDAENWEACSAGQDVFWRVGEPQKRGQRNDLAAAVQPVQAEGGPTKQDVSCQVGEPQERLAQAMQTLREITESHPEMLLQTLREITESHPEMLLQTLREIAETHPEKLGQYEHDLRDLMPLTGSRPRDFKTEVWILWGPPGCGKSRYCHEFEGPKYFKTRGERWDGYSGQENVVIGNFNGWLPFSEMLCLMDRCPHKVRVGDSLVEFTSRRIVITSTKHPYEWYPENRRDLGEFFRRVNYFRFFRRPGVTVDVPEHMRKHPIHP